MFQQKTKNIYQNMPKIKSFRTLPAYVQENHNEVLVQSFSRRLIQTEFVQFVLRPY